MKSLHLALIATVLMAVVVFPSAGCSEGPGTTAQISGKGTVQFVTLEGGFYGILADDGHRYDPINLDQELQVDGIRIRFTAERRKDLTSFHMWGDMIEIVEVQRISDCLGYSKLVHIRLLKRDPLRSPELVSHDDGRMLP